MIAELAAGGVVERALKRFHVEVGGEHALPRADAVTIGWPVLAFCAVVAPIAAAIAGQVEFGIPCVIGGAATLLVTGLWMRLFPVLRHLDTFPNAAEPEPRASALESAG